MHNNKGKTISQSLKARIDYVKNPEKTNGGELITAYACSPETADAEFLLARNEYLATTGRTHRNEVIAYQLRQSFKPGEVTPEEANQIGYELASQFLRGDHAFIVATHNDRRHIHNHIVFCATTLDCTHKFRNVYRSDRLLAKLSDQICAEHNLSVINEPNSQSKPYDQELMTKGEISSRNILRMSIDAALRMQPEGFDALIQLLEDAGCWIKRGAQISIKPPGGKRYIRLDTVGAEYSEEALRMTLAGKHVHIPKQARGKMPHAQIELLINIEAKMRAGKGKGYERWAERHNTDVMASSMLYLIDNHISSYAELEHNIQSAVDRRTELKSTISTAQARMQEISKQKKAILVYRRTKDVYTQYRESGGRLRSIVSTKQILKLIKKHRLCTVLLVVNCPRFLSCRQNMPFCSVRRSKLVSNYHTLTMSLRISGTSNRTWIPFWMMNDLKKNRPGGCGIPSLNTYKTLPEKTDEAKPYDYERRLA